MKFLELNKKRHAIKRFTDQPVDPKDVRTAIEIATLRSQPWPLAPTIASLGNLWLFVKKMRNWQN